MISLYLSGLVTMATYLLFLAEARTMQGPPMSIVFNGFSQGDIRFGNGLLEGIEVDDDQVNGRNIVILHGFHVFRIVADRQNGAVNLGVQGLDAAVQSFPESPLRPERR